MARGAFRSPDKEQFKIADLIGLISKVFDPPEDFGFAAYAWYPASEVVKVSDLAFTRHLCGR